MKHYSRLSLLIWTHLMFHRSCECDLFSEMLEFHRGLNSSAVMTMMSIKVSTPVVFTLIRLWECTHSLFLSYYYCAFHPILYSHFSYFILGSGGSSACIWLCRVRRKGRCVALRRKSKMYYILLVSSPSLPLPTIPPFAFLNIHGPFYTPYFSMPPEMSSPSPS